MPSGDPGWRSAELRDVPVLGFLPNIAAPAPVGFRGGPVLPSTYDYLRHHRRGVPVDDSYDVETVSDTEEPDVISGDIAYGGALINHFGHFLAESVHRILPTRAHRSDVNRWLFVGVDGGPTTLAGYAPFITDVLRSLHIEPDDVVIVTRPTVVRSLLIHEQASHLGHGPFPGYVDLLTSFDLASDETMSAQHSGARSERVYVSRTGSVIGSYLGERYVAECLEQVGFTTLVPESLPFSEQVATYRQAQSLLFAEGSAIHGTELLGSALGHVGIIRRRESAPENFRSILMPRSASLHELGQARFLGNRFRIRGQEGISDGWGVSLMDPRELVTDLRESGLAEGVNITVDDYLTAAANDLREYCQADAPPVMAPQDPQLLDDLWTMFKTFVVDVRNG